MISYELHGNYVHIMEPGKRMITINRISAEIILSDIIAIREDFTTDEQYQTMVNKYQGAINAFDQLRLPFRPFTFR
jgi:hypothetical protein